MSEFVAAVLRFGVYDHPVLRVSGDEWSRFEPIVREQRITGLVNAMVADEVLVIDEVSQHRLRVAHTESMGVSLQLESMLITVLDLLTAESVESRIMKGPAAAYLDYPEPELRSFGDVDLLVRGTDLDRSIAVLERNGCRRRFQEPTPGFTAAFGKGVCVEAPNGFEIDLHRSFVAGPFAVAASPEPLWQSSATVTLGTVAAAALGSAGRLLGAAAHAVLGRSEPRLVPVRDVVQLLTNDPTTFERALGLADELQLTAVLARAIQVTASMLDLEPGVLPGSAWASRYRCSRRESLLIHSYTSAHRSYGLQARAGLLAAPGVRTKLRYATALAFPSRAYLDARDGSYPRRLWRAVTLGSRRP